MQRLTKESEQRISNALAKVTDLTNSGTNPDDAIVKVATAAKLPAGHVNLMVRAFNNGRSLGHIREHETLTEKAAAFPLADGRKILERMFPSEVKTAAEEAHGVSISDDYNMSPAGWLKRRAEAARTVSLVKSAEELEIETKAPGGGVIEVEIEDGEVEVERESAEEEAAEEEAEEKEAAYPAYPYRQEKKALSAMHDLRREHQQRKDAAIKSAYDVTNGVEKLANYFRRFDSRPINEVWANAGARYGQTGRGLVEKSTVMFKQAYAQPSQVTHDVDWDEAPYSLIKSAVDAIARFNDTKKALADFEAALPEKRAETLRPFAPDRPNVITGSVWDNQSQTKSASFMGLTMAGALGGTAKGLAEKYAPETREELIQKHLKSIADPGHEDHLRAIRAQAMIHEMMSADPVISGYDHSDVIDAYNHLAEVAPRAMQHRVMAQGLIRKYLEQASAIDPFDVEQALKIEGQVADRDMPQQLANVGRMGVSRELGPPNPLPTGAQMPVLPSDVSSAMRPSFQHLTPGQDRENRDLITEQKKQLAEQKKQLDALRKPKPNP